MYLCPSEREEYTSDDHIAKIPDKMMGEKIDIDRERDEDGIYFSWIVRVVEIEYPPHTGYVASYCRVHKSGKQRHSHDPDREISWIRP